MKATGSGRAIVIGAGIIGLTLARELAARHWRTTILERGNPGREASRAAAGMLAPHLEFHDSPRLLSVGVQARELYPEFVAELERETETCVDLRLEGILAPVLSTQTAPDGVSGGATLLDRARLEVLEPSLSEHIQSVLFYPQDGSVDNRALLRALRISCRKRGVQIETHAPVEEILVDADRVTGVRTGTRELEADLVINCAGAWSGQISLPGARFQVRPIKGQMLLLERTSERQDAAPTRTIYSGTSYVVPRGDGRIIIGTTVEDRGYDQSIEASAVAKLLQGAIEICPNLASARFVEAWAGLRPLCVREAAREGGEELPFVGPLGPAGSFVACGHYRNGILFAPLTAKVMADCIEKPSSALAASFCLDDAAEPSQAK